MDDEALRRRLYELEVRVANLRAALEDIRDRDPEREALGEATTGAYVGYTDDARRAAEVALAEDDARIEAAR